MYTYTIHTVDTQSYSFILVIYIYILRCVQFSKIIRNYYKLISGVCRVFVATKKCSRNMYLRIEEIESRPLKFFKLVSRGR